MKESPLALLGEFLMAADRLSADMLPILASAVANGHAPICSPRAEVWAREVDQIGLILDRIMLAPDFAEGKAVACIVYSSFGNILDLFAQLAIPAGREERRAARQDRSDIAEECRRAQRHFLASALHQARSVRELCRKRDA